MLPTGTTLGTLVVGVVNVGVTSEAVVDCITFTSVLVLVLVCVKDTVRHAYASCKPVSHIYRWCNIFGGSGATFSEAHENQQFYTTRLNQTLVWVFLTKICTLLSENINFAW